MPLPILLLAFLLRPVSQEELRAGEVVEGEIAYGLDETLTRLAGVGFAGVVGVARGDETILLRGYGIADRASGRPVTPGTVFTVGSITKQFTAAAILALQEDGKLSVEDSIADHLPDVPADRADITLHHLLTHTSGLADPPAGDFDTRATEGWILQHAWTCERHGAPGESYEYLNLNFSLLGIVVEHVSGKGYETFLRERLLAPAGMNDTGYLLPRFAPERLAVGYVDGTRWGTVLERPMLADGPAWTLRANGGLHSTAADMLRWDRALRTGSVLERASVDALETPWVPEGGGSFYGYGWSIQESPTGGKLVCHNGGNGVFFADFLRYVEDDLTIFLATSVGSRMDPDLAYGLAAQVLGRGGIRVPATLARDHEWLERYAGRYALGQDDALEVANVGDRLVISGASTAAWELLGDAGARRAREASGPVADAIARGDDRPLEARYDGFQSPAEIHAELDDARKDWSARLGAVTGVGEIRASGSGERLRTETELRFEKGRAWVRLHWNGGRITGFVCTDEPELDPAVHVEVFPVAPDRFRAFTFRGDDRREVGFELDDGGRATALVVQDLALPRE